MTLTREQRDEWREDAEYVVSRSAYMPSTLPKAASRILALLDALDAAEAERDEFREASDERGEAAERAESERDEAVAKTLERAQVAVEALDDGTWSNPASYALSVAADAIYDLRTALDTPATEGGES